MYAVRQNHLERVRELVAKMEEVTARSPGGRTALHAAAEEGNLEAARILLEAGIPVDVRTRDGQTPLHLTADYGRGCDLVDPDLDRRSPCTRDRQPVNLRVAEAMLEILREQDNSIPAGLAVTDDLPEDIKGEAFMAMWRLMSDRKELLKKLEAKGLEVDALDPEFAEMLRGFPRYLAVASFFLSHGADVNALDAQGETPLHFATELGELEMLELLLSHGANPDLRGTEGGSPARYPMEKAIERYSLKKAKLLLKHGARLVFDGFFPMHTAAGNGQLEILVWLLEQGCDKNQRDEQGCTPIMAAARRGHGNVVAALCERGADLASRDEEGKSLIQLAAGWRDCLEPLLKAGAPVKVSDEKGRTPLHTAALAGDAKALELLIAAGAEINARDESGNTALHAIFFSEENRPDLEFPLFLALVSAGSDRMLKNNEGKTAYDLGVEFCYPREFLDLLNPGR